MKFHALIAVILAWFFIFRPGILYAGAPEAESLSREIQERHSPFGTILDPIFSAPDSNGIIGYTRAGDSAIWTAHYLAAEAFRYRVTGSIEALAYARRALAAIATLVEAPGTGLLARCAIPADSPWLDSIAREEARHGIYDGICAGKPCKWIGHTSRDQYAGVFFGLGAAWDNISDPSVRALIRSIVHRLLDFLLDHHWNILMPDGSISSTFWGRFDQQLTLLAIGRHIDPGRFGPTYERWSRFAAPLTVMPMLLESLTPWYSYHKYNLASINFYHLVHWEPEAYRAWFYRAAYRVLWKATRAHQNAFFTVIHAAIEGKQAGQDVEVGALLAALLARPRRDFPVDLRTVYASCGTPDEACSPIPIQDRVATDFLWQRSPFQLRGNGGGLIESAGIDYLLPYWMARRYGFSID